MFEALCGSPQNLCIIFCQMLSVSHGHGPSSPTVMSTMTGQHGRLSPSGPMGGGSPSASRQKLSTSRGATRQRAPAETGPPLPARNKK